MLCVCLASASGGGKAGCPGRVGPLASPAGPYSPKNQRGGAVVPTEGLHATWPRTPTQEWWWVHRGHPHTDRQRAWWVCFGALLLQGHHLLACFCDFAVDSLLFSAAQTKSIFCLQCFCGSVGVVLLQLPVGPVMCLPSTSVWGQLVRSLCAFVQPCCFIHREFSLILSFVCKGWETKLLSWMSHTLAWPDNTMICVVCILLVSLPLSQISWFLIVRLLELVKWANIVQS